MKKKIDAFDIKFLKYEEIRQSDGNKLQIDFMNFIIGIELY